MKSRQEKDHRYETSWKGRSRLFNFYARRVLQRKGWPENYIEDVDLERIWWEAVGCCAWCGEVTSLNASKDNPLKAHFDHRYPLCWGGRHEQKNIQLLHQICHAQKSRIKR